MKKLWLLTILLGAVTLFGHKKTELPQPKQDDDEPILFI